jgi:hypothetical protein
VLIVALRVVSWAAVAVWVIYSGANPASATINAMMSKLTDCNLSEKACSENSLSIVDFLTCFFVFDSNRDYL